MGIRQVGIPVLTVCKFVKADLSFSEYDDFLSDKRGFILLPQHPEVKLIIAPHVIDENHLVEIIRKLKRPYVRYTRANEKNVRKADCLIIDCFGLLSSIYRYVAYIIVCIFGDFRTEVSEISGGHPVGDKGAFDYERFARVC